MYLFRNIHLMVSKLVLCAVYGTSGFLACLLVQSLLTLRQQGLAELNLVRFTNPLAFSSDAVNTQSCKMSKILHISNLFNQILPQKSL